MDPEKLYSTYDLNNDLIPERGKVVDTVKQNPDDERIKEKLDYVDLESTKSDNLLGKDLVKSFNSQLDAIVMHLSLLYNTFPNREIFHMVYEVVRLVDQDVAKSIISTKSICMTKLKSLERNMGLVKDLVGSLEKFQHNQIDLVSMLESFDTAAIEITRDSDNSAVVNSTMNEVSLVEIPNDSSNDMEIVGYVSDYGLSLDLSLIDL